MTTDQKEDKQKEMQEGSPITVGGGGGGLGGPNVLGEEAYCEFDEAFYTDQTGGGPNQKKFANNMVYAKSLEFALNGTLLRISGAGVRSCQVKVACPGSDNDLVVTGDPLGIEIHTGTYQDPASGHRRNGNTKANEILIKLPDYDIKRTLNPADKFKVKVNYL